MAGGTHQAPRFGSQSERKVKHHHYSERVPQVVAAFPARSSLSWRSPHFYSAYKHWQNYQAVGNHCGFVLQGDVFSSRTFAEPAFLLYMSVLRPKFCRSTDLSFTFSGKDIMGWAAGVCGNTGQNFNISNVLKMGLLCGGVCGPGMSLAAEAPNWRECLPTRGSGRWGEDPWAWAGSRSPPGS